MTPNGWFQLALYLGVLLLLARPLGVYMAAVYEGAPSRWRQRGEVVERWMYRLCGVDPNEQMTWTRYAYAVLMFSIVSFLAVYLIQRCQALLPLNPQQLAAVTADSSFNTAISFVTNTNWQGYGGEVTMSYLSQMLALTVQNFVSAAVGMAVLVALIRGFRQTGTTGLAWETSGSI